LSISFTNHHDKVYFISITLLLLCFDTVGRQEGHTACKNRGWWEVALVSPGVVATSGGRCLPLLIFPCTIKSRRGALNL